MLLTSTSKYMVTPRDKSEGSIGFRYLVTKSVNAVERLLAHCLRSGDKKDNAEILGMRSARYHS
jgi:hypothetical protein